MKRLFLLLLTCAFCNCFAFDSSIPVVDIREYDDPTTKEKFLEEIEKAMVDVGFFAITGVDIDREIMSKAYDESKAFFSLPFETKIEFFKPELHGQRGFIAGESAKEDTRMDFKQFYHIGREEGSGSVLKQGLLGNVWPDGVHDSFKPAMVNFYNDLERFTYKVEEIFSNLLGKHSNYISSMTKKGDVLMRVLYYPSNAPEDSIWASAHTDIDLYTILPKSTARGLQVMTQEGEWKDVIVPEDAFIVNVGDMLENLSNGLYKSSYHRVVDPGLGQERYSIVYFVHPRSWDDMSPLSNFIMKTGGERKYPNATRYELLSERLIDLGLASPDMMKEFVDSGAIDKFTEVGRASPKALKKLAEAGLISN